ncbi:hypothetical protein L0Y69_01340 [bacterium]|nr:hypothetical protein [bacterium]
MQIKAFVLFLSSGAAFAIPLLSSLAQSVPTDPAIAAQVAERRAILEQELAKLEQEIGAQTTLLQGKQKESVSLERDVSILNTQIKKSKLSIKARDITLGNLGQDIGEKEEVIESLTEKIEREKNALGQLLKKTDEVDQASLVEAILGNESLSEFFLDIDSFASINTAIGISMDIIRDAKEITEGEVNILEEKRSEELAAKNAQVLEKKRIEQNESEKKKILAITKGQEKEYKKIISAKQKSAAEIRAALFELTGAKAISFGKALEYANIVSQKTGVRPAFLLGIIAEESNLGENVGTGNWKTDMHPTRDVPVFQQITAKLGLDPDKMPVSKKAWYGWGGAMGPAQFIPSTWIIVEAKVAALTGHAVPNPWDPFDAFMASGVLLSDHGADAKTPKAEHDAAMCYLAGCGNKNKPSLQFYAEDVASLAAKYQAQINILQGIARN